MKNSLDTLGELSGLSKPVMNEILAEVKANHAKLNACPRHDFEPVLPTVALRTRFRCTNCGGEVDHHAWYWHEQGRRP